MSVMSALSSGTPAPQSRDEPDARAYDVAVVGGGVNGVGIARDLAGRGLSVVLFEMGDLASATSSASTKLIHGGLRYLEQYEFALVRKSLIERARLLKLAPHLIWPLRLVLPHDPSLRPKWMLRAGLFLYDTLGGRGAMERSRQIRLDGAVGAPLNPRYTAGFAYSDAWVDDARLVVAAARDAAAHGAEICVRTRVASARRTDQGWRLDVHDAAPSRAPGEGAPARTVTARALVNAAGPWASDMLARTGSNATRSLRLVKGSHVVTRRLYPGDHAYFFQNDDGRVMFVIPYEHDFTLIGTTDTPHETDPDGVAIDDGEIDYLLAEISKRLAAPVTRDDVMWTYSGVRPLLEDGAADAAAVTRGYALELDTGELDTGQLDRGALDTGEGAPLLTVWGGKLTTFRALAEDASDTVCDSLGAPVSHWTRTAPFCGGDLGGRDFDAFLADQRQLHPWLGDALSHRLARAYGSEMTDLLGDAQEMADLGEAFGAGLTTAELKHMRDREWARTGADALWRRSKLGLHLTPAQQDRVSAWFDANPAPGPRSNVPPRDAVEPA